MKFLFGYSKKYRFIMAFGMAVKLSAAVAELMLPYVLEHLVDDVAPQQNAGLVLMWGAVMLMLVVYVRQANVKANRTAVKVAKNSIYEIRRDLFWKSVNLSGGQLDEFGLPSLNSRMTSDSYNLQSFIQSSQTMGIRAPILLLGGDFHHPYHGCGPGFHPLYYGADSDYCSSFCVHEGHTAL